MIDYLDQALVISIDRLGIWDSICFRDWGLEIFIADQALAIADLGLEIDCKDQGFRVGIGSLENWPIY